jgi:hypothetical protein
MHRDDDWKSYLIYEVVFEDFCIQKIFNNNVILFL